MEFTHVFGPRRPPAVRFFFSFMARGHELTQADVISAREWLAKRREQ